MPEISLRRAGPARARWPALCLRFSATSDQLVLAAGVFWALAVNRPFFAAAMRAHSGADDWSWSLVAGLAMILAALHVLLLGLVCSRRTVKPVLAVLAIAAALGVHFIQAYGVVLDPPMLRNALHSEFAETRELLNWGLALDLFLYAVMPISLLAFANVEPQSWRRALVSRMTLLGMALAVMVGALLWQFQPLSSLMRNHKELRYLITPANGLWSGGSVLAADARGAARPRQPIGQDAAPGPTWTASRKPRVMVIVVGETVRAGNWGLNGYARQTTPRLAQLPVLNFPDVTACGTSTEVSLPCMFAPVGRRDYDEAKIRGSESLLHVLARAGAAVQWRDNQSGCKGVCDGLPADALNAANAPGLCQGDRCWDEGLLRGLDDRLQRAQGVQVVVLHMLGNHGPSYFRRYPKAFERFAPTCQDDNIGNCTKEQIVNAYDNAVVYTDHVLATLISTLEANAAKVDSAVLYASDHGESLGEKGLFLHGMPNAIAPREQTQVPMFLWWTKGFGQTAEINGPCMQRRTAAPAQHDHLFHTVLGMLDVKTSLYEPQWDLTAGCRGAAAAAQ